MHKRAEGFECELQGTVLQTQGTAHAKAFSPEGARPDKEMPESGWFKGSLQGKNNRKRPEVVQGQQGGLRSELSQGTHWREASVAPGRWVWKLQRRSGPEKVVAGS